MTEQPSAQSKLGELFVEIGSKGALNLIKELTGIDLNTKVAAKGLTLMTEELEKMSRKLGSEVTGFSKLSAVMGLSVGELQQLKTWTQLNSVEFGEMIGQVQTLQQNLLNIARGRGNVQGFADLGLDPREMDYRKPLEALGKIRERVQQLDEATGALALREFGLSEDLLFAFKQQTKQIDERLFLTKEEIATAREMERVWKRLDTVRSLGQNKFIAQQEWINTSVKDFVFLVEQAFILWGKFGNLINKVGTTLQSGAQVAGQKTGEFISNFSNPTSSLTKRPMTPEQKQVYEQKLKESLDVPAKTLGEELAQSITYQTIYYKLNEAWKNAPWQKNNIDPATTIPSSVNNSMSNTSNNVQLTVNQTISGNDSQEIATRSVDQFEDVAIALTGQNTVGL